MSAESVMTAGDKNLEPSLGFTIEVFQLIARCLCNLNLDHFDDIDIAIVLNKALPRRAIQVWIDIVS